MKSETRKAFEKNSSKYFPKESLRTLPRSLLVAQNCGSKKFTEIRKKLAISTRTEKL